MSKESKISLNFNPVQYKERTVIVDILRGFALFGVLFTNLYALTTTIPALNLSTVTDTGLDKLTNALVQLFFIHKFLTLFSLLFGYGFGIFIERLTSKGITPNQFIIRRMAILFLLGLLHTCFWWGEILSTYALCGIFLLFLRKLQPKHLLTFGLILIFIAAPFFQYIDIVWFTDENTVKQSVFLNYLQTISNASLHGIIKINYVMSNTLYMHYSCILRDGFQILGKFLIGFYILKQGYLKNPESHLDKIKLCWKISLIAGLLYVIVKSLYLFHFYTINDNIIQSIVYLLNNIGILSLSLFYATSLMLLFLKNPKLIIFIWLRNVGILSLTNYLSQTVFYFFIFTGIGFGLLGKMHLYMIIPLTLAIFSLEIIISKYWLKYYIYGPMEWIWRQLTYRKHLKIRKQKAEDIVTRN